MNNYWFEEKRNTTVGYDSDRYHYFEYSSLINLQVTSLFFHFTRRVSFELRRRRPSIWVITKSIDLIFGIN